MAKRTKQTKEQKQANLQRALDRLWTKATNLGPAMLTSLNTIALEAASASLTEACQA
jgi:hypothetical protein